MTNLYAIIKIIIYDTFQNQKNLLIRDFLLFNSYLRINTINYELSDNWGMRIYRFASSRTPVEKWTFCH